MAPRRPAHHWNDLGTRLPRACARRAASGMQRRSDEDALAEAGQRPRGSRSQQRPPTAARTLAGHWSGEGRRNGGSKPPALHTARCGEGERQQQNATARLRREAARGSAEGSMASWQHNVAALAPSDGVPPTGGLDDLECSCDRVLLLEVCTMWSLWLSVPWCFCHGVWRRLCFNCVWGNRCGGFVHVYNYSEAYDTLLL